MTIKEFQEFIDKKLADQYKSVFKELHAQREKIQDAVHEALNGHN